MMTEMNREITISFAFWCFCRVLQQVSQSGSLFDLLFDQNCVFIIPSAQTHLLENKHTLNTEIYVMLSSQMCTFLSW